MKWETVIGLETHAQLSTRSKIFSGASTAFGAAPNTQACAVDIALPGVLPVLNRGAVERAIRFGLAVGGKINRRSIFARKNYFYPDLPKGYQISQYELPIVEGGAIDTVVDGREKTVRLTRAHLEEDAGKSIHGEALSAVPGYAVPGLAIPGMGLVSNDLDLRTVSGIDLNRAGTPLLEIVTEPDMHSAEEAVAYAKTLHSLVRWIDICDGNMQEGSFRCDANVSVRRPGEPLGTRCEIKNLNSFRFMEQAINFEVHRQIELIEDGGKVLQETRLYDPDKDETRSMRSKEDAMDYRYFPDPDLLPLVVNPDMLKSIEDEMPELPGAMRQRFVREYGFTEQMAHVLTQDRERAEHFDQFWGYLLTLVDGRTEIAIQGANWAMIEVASMVNRAGTEVTRLPVSPKYLAEWVGRILDGTISHKMAKEVFAAMWAGEGSADEIIQKRGLRQISESSEIEKIVDQVLAVSTKSVDEFKAGKEKAFNALVGQVMKATKGKANPAQVNALLKQKLGGS
jgi:aspartyl-tRNA(Asn)/glutamyl-tRNA(Gln) amidotransferase subunit B